MKVIRYETVTQNGNLLRHVGLVTGSTGVDVNCIESYLLNDWK